MKLKLTTLILFSMKYEYRYSRYYYILCIALRMGNIGMINNFRAEGNSAAFPEELSLLVSTFEVD